MSCSITIHNDYINHGIKVLYKCNTLDDKNSIVARHIKDHMAALHRHAVLSRSRNYYTTPRSQHLRNNLAPIVLTQTQHATSHLTQ